MKKQARFLLILLTFVLLSSLVVFGCAAPQPAAPPPTEAPPPAEVEPIVMTCAVWLPPVHSYVWAALEPWVAEVEKQTNGRLKINLALAAALAPPPEHYDLGVTGAADLTYFMPSFTPGRFPLSSVLELPFMTRRCTPSVYAMNELYREFPEIQAEFKDVRIDHFVGTEPMEVFTSKKAVRKLEDLKGVTLRVPNERTGEALKLLGGVPVFMPMGDLYMAIDRGTIDGCIVAIEACKSFRVCEVTKYATKIDVTCIFGALAWNINSWNSLPQDIKDLLEGEELGPYYLIDRATRQFELETEESLGIMKEGGVELIELSPTEKARWVDVAMPVRQSWVADMEAKGLPGQKVLDEAIRLEDKYYREFE